MITVASSREVRSSIRVSDGVPYPTAYGILSLPDTVLVLELLAVVETRCDLNNTIDMNLVIC